MIWALHGAVGRTADWRIPAEVIQAQYGQSAGEIRRLDLWRFLDCCPMSLDQIGKTLADEIGRVDSNPVLMGYSMGGRLALHALLASPDLWKGAVIVSAHPGLTEEVERSERRRSDAEWSALALKGEWSQFLEKWEGQSVLNGAGVMPDRMQLKGRRVSVARSFVDWSLGAQQDLRGMLGAISCPLLWLSGERDAKFTGLAADAVSRIPNARHQVIENSGHRVPWEQPDAFCRSVGEFALSL